MASLYSKLYYPAFCLQAHFQSADGFIAKQLASILVFFLYTLWLPKKII